MEQPPAALSQRPELAPREEDGIRFVVVGGRVQRGLPGQGPSRSGAARLGESATTRVSATVGTADFSKNPPQNQSASHTAFTSGAALSKRPGSQRYVIVAGLHNQRGQ